MPPTLASLVRHSALKLTVRAGEDRLDVPVRWAHVSELADPVPYMEGGELLLITALKLDAEDPDVMRRYVKRLAGAGVVGLGFAVGVNYDEIPQALLDAARGEGLPLLEVPRRTPFLAITKAVSAAIAADQYRAVTAGFAAQRELTRQALGEGPEGLLAALAAQIDGWAALYDASGAVAAAAPEWAGRRAARLTADVERLRDRPAPASSVVGGPEHEDRVELHTIGTGRRPRAALAVGTAAALGTAERYALHSAIALLTLTTERSRSLQAAEQRIGAAVLRMLVAGQPDHARAAAGDLYGGLLDAPYRIVLAEGASGHAGIAETVEAAAARSGESVLVVPDGERLVVLAADGGAAVAACGEHAAAREAARAARSRRRARRTTWSSACRRRPARARRPPPTSRPSRRCRWRAAGAGCWSSTSSWLRGRCFRCSPTTRSGPSRTACCARCTSTTPPGAVTWSPPCGPGCPGTASGTRPPPTSASTGTPCGTGCGAWRRSSDARWTTRTSAWSCGWR
ncbi:hypothetical protein GCM10020295_22270 [Streptomyces cinereospinus]